MIERLESAGNGGLPTDNSVLHRVLFVTGLSGAGKTTALKTLEDVGWEVIDNFPIRLFEELVHLPRPQAGEAGSMPVAIGFDTRTRGFRPHDVLARLDDLNTHKDILASLLVLNCTNSELERRYNETRRRHPMAHDRPASAGIEAERALLGPFFDNADHLIDTSMMTASDLQSDIRRQFSFDSAPGTTIQVTSFGYSRGVPHNADLIFDMRFLRNPHWDKQLRPKTGLEADVAAYIAEDPAYHEALQKIHDLLMFLLPRYEAEGKPYVTIAFGCTGGKHRSVHVADTMGKWLQDAGFSPTVMHRNLTSPVNEAQEERRRDLRSQPGKD